MDISIAGAKRRPLGGVKQPVNLQMITPCNQQDHNTGEHQKVVADVFGNVNFWYLAGPIICQKYFADKLNPAVLYIPDNRYQSGKQKQNQQLFA